MNDVDHTNCYEQKKSHNQRGGKVCNNLKYKTKWKFVFFLYSFLQICDVYQVIFDIKWQLNWVSVRTENKCFIKSESILKKTAAYIRLHSLFWIIVCSM